MNRKESEQPESKKRYYAAQRRPLPNMATPRKPRPPKRSGSVSLLLLLGILLALVWISMMVFRWGFYETAEPTQFPTRMSTRTSTAGPTTTAMLTATRTPTSAASATATQIPTSTLTPTLTPSPTLELLPFVLKGEPELLSSALIRPELGCNWLIVAGQVLDLQDTHLTGLTLHLYGELNGVALDRFILTGSAPVYGESGYEFALEGFLVDSSDTLYIQLVDTNALPLSHPYALTTFNDCQKNLILVNFKQVR